MPVNLVLDIDVNISQKEILNLMYLSGFNVINETDISIDAEEENLSMNIFWDKYSDDELDIDCPLHFSRHSYLLFVYPYSFWGEGYLKIKTFLSHFVENSSAFFVLTNMYEYNNILAFRDGAGVRIVSDY